MGGENIHGHWPVEIAKHGQGRIGHGAFSLCGSRGSEVDCPALERFVYFEPLTLGSRRHTTNTTSMTGPLGGQGNSCPAAFGNAKGPGLHSLDRASPVERLWKRR